MKKVFVCFIVLCLSTVTFALFASRAEASTTINVNPGDSIATAVSTASAGDIILVSAGTYHETSTIHPTVSNLTIEGAGTSVTIIRSDVAAFTINTAVQNLTIEGFTVTSIGGDDGVYCQVLQESASGTITNNIITHNEIEDNLNGVYLEGGCGFTVSNNTINNSIDGGVDVEDPTVPSNIYNNQITNNALGILNDSSDIGSPANISIHNNSISANLSGIIMVTPNASVYGNSIFSNTGPMLGAAGITAFGGTAHIYGNKIYQNTNTMIGGVFVISIESASNIYNNYISGNSATASIGGGLVSVANDAPIFNNTIVNNTAVAGQIGFNDPGLETIQLNGHGLDSFETKLQDELAQINFGQQYFFAGNTNLGGGVLIDHDTAPAPAFYNNILWGNTDDLYDVAGDLVVAYSDIEEGHAGTGNIQADPRLTGYVLASDSPAIDTGTATGAPINDIDLTVRPQRAGIDMGAYELPNPTVTVLPATGSVNNRNLFFGVIAFLAIILIAIPVKKIVSR